MSVLTSPSKVKAAARAVPAHRRFASFYSRSFDKRPLLTISVANSVLGFVGDGAAQLLPLLAGSTGLSWDIWRSFRFLAYGMMVGPVAGKWNELLENRIPLRQRAAAVAPSPFEKVKVEVPLSEKTKAPNSPLGRPVPSAAPVYPNAGSRTPSGRVSLWALAKRVIADQLFMAPLGIFIFISAMSAMEGLDISAWADRLQRLFIPVLLVNWQIWPFVQAINFRFMPLKYRVPFTATCGVLWTVFLSLRQASAAQEAKFAATK